MVPTRVHRLSFSETPLELCPAICEVGGQTGTDSFREDRDAVLVSFPPPHRNRAALEVQIVNPQFQRLPEPQPRAQHDSSQQPHRAAASRKVIDDRRRFLSVQQDRQPAGHPRPQIGTDFTRFLADAMAEE
jgi:hypothetical protein